MSLFSKLLNRKNPELKKPDGSVKTSGELITEITGGANLVNGKQTWELASEGKSDIEVMKECCLTELRTMDTAGLAPAPYYFERVAILSRKEKLYEQEVFFCEQYIEKIESFYKNYGAKDHADVRKGPRYKAIVQRLPKAKELLKKNLTRRSSSYLSGAGRFVSRRFCALASPIFAQNRQLTNRH